MVRPAAVAGTWYPATAAALADAVDGYLGRATREVTGDLVALVAPHAGLVYSGPVAAHAYRLLAGRTFDAVVIVGPSHFVSFEGVAVPAAEGFDTPFGIVRVDTDITAALLDASPIVREQAQAHGRWGTRWAACLAAVVRCSWRAPTCRTITMPSSRPASTPW
jgi:AmmeMemoRadiSam system protein B